MANRFATLPQPGALQVVQQAARLTFQGVPEDPGSHYHQASGFTPQETSTRILRQVEIVTATTALDALDGGSLSSVDIALIHEAIFSPVFGRRTLEQRSQPSDRSTYGVMKGTRARPVESNQQGTGGQNVRSMLGRVLRDFERERRELALRAAALEARGGFPLVEAVRPAAKLYARFIGVHPFLDGNGRTGYPLLTHGLIRCGALAVALPESEDFHWCLGRAMRKDKPGDYEPLARYTSQVILDSQGSAAL